MKKHDRMRSIEISIFRPIVREVQCGDSENSPHNVIVLKTKLNKTRTKELLHALVNRKSVSRALGKVVEKFQLK